MDSFRETYNGPFLLGRGGGGEGGFATCKGMRIPEFEKIFLVESRIKQIFALKFGILGFGIWNTAKGIQESH